MILYGIATCESCKRARKDLERAGHQVTFRDVRSAPLGTAEIAEFAAAFGDAIVNRQSTTWRGLSAFLRAAEPEAQIAAQPVLMKRPVIRAGDRLHLGWGPEVQAALLG